MVEGNKRISGTAAKQSKITAEKKKKKEIVGFAEIDNFGPEGIPCIRAQERFNSEVGALGRAKCRKTGK